MKSQETLVGLPKYVAGKGNPDGFNLDFRKLGWFHLGISGNPSRCRSGFQWSLQILMPWAAVLLALLAHVSCILCPGPIWQSQLHAEDLWIKNLNSTDFIFNLCLYLCNQNTCLSFVLDASSTHARIVSGGKLSIGCPPRKPTQRD